MAETPDIHAMNRCARALLRFGRARERDLSVRQRLGALLLGRRHFDEPLRFGVAARIFGRFAGADEIEMHRRRFRSVRRSSRRPRFRLRDLIAGEHAVFDAPCVLPFRRAHQKARVLAQPVEVGVERARQLHEAGAKSCVGRRLVRIEEDVVLVGETLRRLNAFERAAHDRQDALSEPRRLVDLPRAD